MSMRDQSKGIRPMHRILTKRFALALVAAAGLAASGCGFQPLYATTETDAGVRTPGLRSIHLADLDAPDTVEDQLKRNFARRAARADGSSDALYELRVNATEQSERLAVQIDASVTRFNYRLVGKYALTDRKTGETLTGEARSIASFNIVSSQYSTLFAEKTAREKAARDLVEDIERDILLKLAEKDDKAKRAAAKSSGAGL